jgi:hypothetical protein
MLQINKEYGYMDQLDQLEALIEAELQLYGESQDVAFMDDMSPTEAQQYKVSKENPKNNLSRIHLLQEIKIWIGQIREDMRVNDNVSPDTDPLSLLERRILENVSETDLITSEVLQKVNIWISEIRDRNL